MTEFAKNSTDYTELPDITLDIQQDVQMTKKDVFQDLTKLQEHLKTLDPAIEKAYQGFPDEVKQAVEVGLRTGKLVVDDSDLFHFTNYRSEPMNDRMNILAQKLSYEISNGNGKIHTIQFVREGMYPGKPGQADRGRHAANLSPLVRLASLGLQKVIVYQNINPRVNTNGKIPEDRIINGKIDTVQADFAWDIDYLANNGITVTMIPSKELRKPKPDPIPEPEPIPEPGPVAAIDFSKLPPAPTFGESIEDIDPAPTVTTPTEDPKPETNPKPGVAIDFNKLPPAPDFSERKIILPSNVENKVYQMENGVLDLNGWKDFDNNNLEAVVDYLMKTEKTLRKINLHDTKVTDLSPLKKLKSSKVIIINIEPEKRAQIESLNK